MIDEHHLKAASGIVRLDDVSFSYGRTRVLENLTLSIGSGITGLLGVNGVGKTTILRLIATTTRPGSGSVRIFDDSARHQQGLRRIRRRIGYLPQDAGWTGSVRVGDFVEYFAWLRRIRARDRRHAVEQALERTNTTALRDRRLSDLSGGEHQRVMLAQALVHEPALLILDEPTGGLDPEQRHAFRSVLRAVGGEFAVILSTHLLEDVADLAREVVVLRDGAVALQDTPAKLAERAWDRQATTSAMEQGFLRTIQGEFGE